MKNFVQFLIKYFKGIRTALCNIAYKLVQTTKLNKITELNKKLNILPTICEVRLG